MRLIHCAVAIALAALWAAFPAAAGTVDPLTIKFAHSGSLTQVPFRHLYLILPASGAVMLLYLLAGAVDELRRRN